MLVYNLTLICIMSPYNLTISIPHAFPYVTELTNSAVEVITVVLPPQITPNLCVQPPKLRLIYAVLLIPLYTTAKPC